MFLSVSVAFHAAIGLSLNGNWDFMLMKDVNNLLRYTWRVGTSAATATPPAPYVNSLATLGYRVWPTGLDIFGGVYARYVNITSTNGLAIYHDPRNADLGHEPLYVQPGRTYQEDPVDTQAD